MGWYLYAIAPAALAPAATLTGIDGARVETLAAEDLLLWVSALPQPVQPTLERVRQHNDVVAAAASAEDTAVPVRFGQWSADAARLVASVAAGADIHRSRLHRLKGVVEYGIRIIDPGRAPRREEVEQERPSSGREFMQRLASRESRLGDLDPRARELADAMAAALRERIKDQRCTLLPSQHGLLSIAHLVPRHEVSSYRADVDAFAAASPELRFLVSGPWPPYSFVE